MKQNLYAVKTCIFLSLLSVLIIGCNRGDGSSGTGSTTEQPGSSAAPPEKIAPASPAATVPPAESSKAPGSEPAIPAGGAPVSGETGGGSK